MAALQGAQGMRCAASWTDGELGRIDLLDGRSRSLLGAKRLDGLAARRQHVKTPDADMLCVGRGVEAMGDTGRVETAREPADKVLLRAAVADEVVVRR